MKYIGQFYCGYNADRLLTLRFTTATEGPDVALTLGASPFTTAMSEGKTLYEPARYEAATANIIVGDYLFDLYSGKAQGTRAELLDSDGSVLWTGYVDPTIYRQGFARAREAVAVNCSCALASLQYLKHRTNDKGAAVTMAALMARTLSRCNAYTAFYVPKNIHVPEAATDPFGSIIISEENFFAKRRDPKQTDDELAWTCREVLEEICRYFGVTAVAVGDKVLLLDYDALLAGDTEVWAYSVEDGTCTGSSTLKALGLAADVAVTGDTYAATGATLSLEKVYNKVTVTDSFNKMDEVTIDPFAPEALHNITAASDPCGIVGDSPAEMDSKKGALLEVCNVRLAADDETPQAAQRLFDSVYKVKEDEWNDPNLVVMRFHTSDNVTLDAYVVSEDGTPSPAAYPEALGWSSAKEFTGGALAYYAVHPLAYKFVNTVDRDHSKDFIAHPHKCPDNEFRVMIMQMKRPDDNYRADKFSWDGAWTRDWREGTWVTRADLTGKASNIAAAHDDLAARLAVRSLSAKPVICLFNPDRRHIDPSGDYDKIPYFTVKEHKVRGGFAGGADAYLVISGNLVWQYDQADAETGQNPYPVPSGQISPIGRKKKLDRNYMYIPSNECWTYAFLRHAGRSWDGTAWVDDPQGDVFFKLWYFQVDDANEKRTVPQCISTDIPIRNTIDYTMGIGGGLSGTAIPLPAEWGILERTPRFGLCKPHDPEMWYRQDEGPHFYTFDRVFIKDLSLAVTVGGSLDRDINAETKFTNIIDEANAVELPEVKLRVTTYDAKKLAYSNVAVRTADGTRFLGRWINKALKDKELAWTIDNEEYATAADGLCAEEHLVFKLVNQYSRPARAFTLTRHGADAGFADLYTDALLPGCRMVPVTINRDWRSNSATVKVVEKF